MEFENQVFLIVDGNTELGWVLSNLLLQRGAHVVLNHAPPYESRTVSYCQSNPEVLTSPNLHITQYSLAQINEAIEHLLKQLGRIDGLVFNASSSRAPAEGVGNSHEWSHLRSVNIDGAYQCVKAVWPRFRKRNHGRIVFTTPHSEATKVDATCRFALLGFAHTLAREGLKYNIFTNVVMDQSRVTPLLTSCVALMNSTVPLYVNGLNQLSTSGNCIRTLGAMTVALLHTTNKEHHGSAFQANECGITRLRWERSKGAALNPERNFTLDALLQRWEEVVDFSEKDCPDGPKEFDSMLPITLALPMNTRGNRTRFDGKVAIITGAAAGLGRCYALAFAKLGASVLVNDFADPSPVVKEITSAGGQAVGCRASCEDGEKVVQTAINAFGHVNILVNNAGFLRDKAFVNMEPASWKNVLDVHMNGTYNMTQAVWPHFVQQGQGSIVNTTSTSGVYGVFGQTNYSAAKLGILGISEDTAQEGAKYGIRVNTIAPVASTGALAAAWAKTNEKAKDLAMKPEYNVPMVLLLSSDLLDSQSNTITGGLFEIGCGWHAATRLRPSSGCRIDKTSQITPEAVLSSWSPLPTDVLNTIHQYKRLEVGRQEYTYGERDVILYNLSAGATRMDLPLVYEQNTNFQALPGFGIIPFFNRAVISHHADLLPNFSLSRSLLGEHYLEILRHPIPTSGRLLSTGRLIEVIDKGKAAVATTGYNTVDADTGEKLFYNEVTFFMGGAGGFGGQQERTNRSDASHSYEMPRRAPDELVDFQTSEEQAALFRLNGDREAIHIDPVASGRSGFKRPILHGHCAMSIAATHIYRKFGAIRSIKARFVGVVVPGDLLKISMWRDGSMILYQAQVAETGKLCISSGCAQLLELVVPISHF